MRVRRELRGRCGGRSACGHGVRAAAIHTASRPTRHPRRRVRRQLRRGAGGRGYSHHRPVSRSRRSRSLRVAAQLSGHGNAQGGAHEPLFRSDLEGARPSRLGHDGGFGQRSAAAAAAPGYGVRAVDGQVAAARHARTGQGSARREHRLRRAQHAERVRRILPEGVATALGTSGRASHRTNGERAQPEYLPEPAGARTRERVRLVHVVRGPGIVGQAAARTRAVDAVARRCR